MELEALAGRRIKVKFDNTDSDYFYTIKNVLENSEHLLIFTDRDDKLHGINKRYIKEMI